MVDTTRYTKKQAAGKHRTQEQIAEEAVFAYERRLAGMTLADIAVAWHAKWGVRPAIQTVANRLDVERRNRVVPVMEEYREMQVHWLDEHDPCGCVGGWRSTGPT